MKNFSTVPRMKRMFVAALLFSLMSATSFAQTALFRDDFNGSMQSGWTWTRENPATWSLTPTGLQIESEYGDLWQGWTNNCRNMLLRPAPSSDFIIEAKLDVSLVAPINQAHILLYYNDDYYVRFGPVLSYGYQIVIDVVHEVGGGIAHQSAVSWGSNLLYLKIDKSGSNASCYYSSDGQNWTLHHTISNLNFSVDQVGLVAFDGSEPPSASVATYDYFEIREPAPPQCVNPPSGLVSWWPGENNANDIQSSNHGTLQNGATFAAGKVGQAFSFDGVDDYVSLPLNSGTGDFTIEFWEQSSSNALYKVALSFGASANPSTDNLVFDFNDPDLPGGVGLWVYWKSTGANRITTGSIGNFTNGQWHHIALTRSGVNMTLYVNGATVGSTVYAPAIDLAGFDVNNIGASQFLANFWEGSVDEVSIYNRALSASEIQSIYNSSSAGKCTTPPVCVTPPSGLVSWWPGESNANDIQDGNDGALQNGATFAAGKVGQAFSLDGVDDHTLLPQSNDWNFGTGDFTIEFWERSSNLTRRHALSFEPNYGISNLDFNFNDPDLFGAPVGLWVYWNSNGINRITVGSVGDYTDGQWHHIALTRSGTIMTLYVDGSVAGSAIYSPAIDLSTSNNNYIGAALAGGTSPALFWDGSIDEISIYHSALSASEIQSIYTAGSAGKCKCEVTFNPVGPFCANAAAVDLSSAVSPAGGTFSGPGISGTMFDPAAAGAGTHTVTYSVTDANNCTNSASQNIVVHPLPVANAGADQIINAGQSVQIGGSPTASGGNGGPYTISWSPTAGLDNSNAANPMSSPASTMIYTVTVTEDATGCHATDEVTVQVNQGKAFVLLANKITLKRDKQLTPVGDIHSNGTLTIEKGDPSVYNSKLTAVGKITILKDNTINGDVTSATAIDNQGTINGSATVGAVDNEPLPSKNYSAGGQNKTVPANGVLALTPGSYNIVTLNSGGTLKLASGDYFFNELRYSSSVTGAVIEIDLASGAPANVNVVSNLQLGKKATLRLLPDGEDDSDLVTFCTLQSTPVSIGKEAYFLGTLNAPNAKLTLAKNSQLRGAICANEIVVERDCLFLHHDSPSALPGPGNLPKSSSDEEVISEQLAVTSYQLTQNYPNPFNPSTSISFSVKDAGLVQLTVYNLHGQEVRTLINGQMEAGFHSVSWDGKDERGQILPSGVYLYKLRVNGFAQTRKMTFMK